MAHVEIDGLRLHVREWGASGDFVVFIHGNLACGDWIALAAPLVSANFRIVAIDWRGCGDSDKPPPAADFANYSLETHARDMLAVLRALNIDRCHLATHSTGGLIALYMLLMDPDRFGRVVGLDPVGPSGLAFPPDSRVFFETMKASRDKARKGLALTAPTLFRGESLGPGETPRFADTASQDQRRLFERLVDRTFAVSDGIWFGTPFHLDRARYSAGPRDRLAEIRHPHLVLWGDRDAFIPRPDLEAMAAALPKCRLVVVPGVGHSMNIERPELYARYLAEFLSSPA